MCVEVFLRDTHIPYSCFINDLPWQRDLQTGIRQDARWGCILTYLGEERSSQGFAGPGDRGGSQKNERHGLEDTNLSKSWGEEVENKETDSARQPQEGVTAAWFSGSQNLQLTNVCCFKLLT